MELALKNMNRLVKKVLQMYIGIEWNSMDEFDRCVPAIFSQGLRMHHAKRNSEESIPKNRYFVYLAISL